MTESRKSYSREFKLETLELLKTSGKSKSRIEADLGLGKGTLSRWQRQLATDGQYAFPGHGRLTPEQDRLRELERENAVLRQERDILKKAVSIFSRPNR